MRPERVLPSLILIVGLTVVAGCGGGDSTPASPGAAETSLPAPASDDPIVATPSTAAPGDLVELTFPTDLDRGANWHLVRWNGESWSEPQYFVVASSRGYNADGPNWQPKSEVWSGEDIGFIHGGPDTVVVPDSADAGTWRFCTANAAGGPHCVNVEVSNDV